MTGLASGDGEITASSWTGVEALSGMTWLASGDGEITASSWTGVGALPWVTTRVVTTVTCSVTYTGVLKTPATKRDASQAKERISNDDGRERSRGDG